MKTRTLKTSEMAIFVSFALFIVFDFFGVEWDTNVFHIKTLNVFLFSIDNISD